ncbi:DnaB-like helicase N-terminal domain-containing protein [Streptomyces cinereoruber]|uniref:DnaB-like helicase N-terminal domain-containing protein n=1 Tax=Streptomyces cinereoruber TaxID=67260 RepID=UPI0036B88F89
MPHTPEPDDDPYYEPAEPTPGAFAEKALLGALLLDPAHLADVSGLEPDAFSNATHGALFAAMHAVPAPGARESRAGLDWLNAVLEEAHQEAPGLSASYLHTLISACPRVEHASAYAAMVRAEAARRSIRRHADRLAQAADDTTVPDRHHHTLDAADALARHLDALARHFPSHPGSLPRTPPPSPSSETDPDVAVEEERLLLASALARPDAAQAMRWLVAEDFVDPVHGGLWRCLTGLVHRGQPADPVTVLWEAQQRGVLAAGITPTEVVALLSEGAGAPDHWGEQVLGRALLARARHTAARIGAYADDPATTLYQVLTGSRRVLADLTAVRTRWQHATRPPNTATAAVDDPAVAARAGPRTRPTTTPPVPLRRLAARPAASRAP